MGRMVFETGPCAVGLHHSKEPILQEILADGTPEGGPAMGTMHSNFPPNLSVLHICVPAGLHSGGLAREESTKGCQSDGR